MGLFEQFPYTNFHEMNLDWILNKVKEMSLEWDETKTQWENLLAIINGSDEDEFKQKIFDYMVSVFSEYEDTILTDKSLTTNDVDSASFYSYIYDNSLRNGGVTQFSVMQTFCIGKINNHPYIIAIFNDEIDAAHGGQDFCKVRMFDFLTGALVQESGSGLLQNPKLYHAQDCCFVDGYVYVCPSQDKAGNAVQAIIRMDPLDYSCATIPIAHSASSIAYNPDKEVFYLKPGSGTVYVYDKMMNPTGETFYLDDAKTKTYNTSNFPNLARQGMEYYNGMLLLTFAYPNIIEAFSVEDQHKVMTYNLTSKTKDGLSIAELEAICYYDGMFYASSLDVIDADFAHLNNIIRLDFTKNLIAEYYLARRTIQPYVLYVDGDTTNARQTGTEAYPFKNISQAIQFLDSLPAATNSAMIYCKGTVGALTAHEVNIPIYIQGYHVGDYGYPIIQGMTLNHCPAAFFSNIKFADGERTEFATEASVRIMQCDTGFWNCEFESTTPQYCLKAFYGSTVSIYQCSFNLSGNRAEAAIQANSLARIRVSANCTFNAPAASQIAGTAWIDSPERRDEPGTYAYLPQTIKQKLLYHSSSAAGTTVPNTYAFDNDVTVSADEIAGYTKIGITAKLYNNDFEFDNYLEINGRSLVKGVLSLNRPRDTDRTCMRVYSTDISVDLANLQFDIIDSYVWNQSNNTTYSRRDTSSYPQLAIMKIWLE